MPTFYYKAKQKDAQTTYGQVNAQDKEEAVEKISQMDLLPVVIQAEPIRGATKPAYSTVCQNPTPTATDNRT